MKITLIEPQKKKGRYNIYIDNEFSFGVYEDTLVKFGLRKNDNIDEKKIMEIKNYDEFNYGKKIAYNYLKYRQRSEKELRDRLRKQKISNSNIEKILTFFRNHNFINDENFAKSMIGSIMSKKPAGKKLITQKLLQKGINKNVIFDLVELGIKDEVEEENAIILLNKYVKKLKEDPTEKKYQRAFRYLLSRGFSYDISEKAVKKILKTNY